MGLPFKQILIGTLLLPALVGLMDTSPNDVIAFEGPVYPSKIYKIDGPDVDLFLIPAAINPVDGVKLFHVGGENSKEAMIKAEIALFNGGADEVTIPEGVRILTFSHKGGGSAISPKKKVVNVVTETSLQVPGRSAKYPGFTTISVYFDQDFLHSGINELIYKVDPDNEVAELTYPVFEWYQAQLSLYGDDIRQEWQTSSETINSYEIAEFEKTQFMVTCTIIANPLIPKTSSVVTIGCENGITGTITDFWDLVAGPDSPVPFGSDKGKYISCNAPCSVGTKIKLESGFKVNQEGEIVLAPDVSESVKVWPPGYYIFGEHNNQNDLAPNMFGPDPDKKHNILKLYHPDSYPDLVITATRIDPETLYLVPGQDYLMGQEYTLVVEGVNNGADLVGGYKIWACKIGSSSNTIHKFTEPVKSGEQFKAHVKIVPGKEGTVGAGGSISYRLVLSDSPATLIYDVAHDVSYKWKTSSDAPKHPHWSTTVAENESGTVDGTYWAALFNLPSESDNPYWGAPQLAGPREKGSGNRLIPAGSLVGMPCGDSGPEISHGNVATAVASFYSPSPSVIYPNAGDIWEQGVYPPYLARGYINKAGKNAVYSAATSCGNTGSKHAGLLQRSIPKNRTVQVTTKEGQLYRKSPDMWSYDCAGMGKDFFDAPIWGGSLWLTSTILVDEEFKATEKWFEGWLNSLVRFRWIQAHRSLKPEFKVQIHDDAQSLIYETITQPTIEMGFGPGHKTGILKAEPGEYDEAFETHLTNLGYSEIHADVFIEAFKSEPFINQWVYDGPPLGSGTYTFRVAYHEVDAEAASWSEKLPFVIGSEETTPGDSITLRDTELDQAMRFVGTITGIALDSILVNTEAGDSVHLNIDDDTVISTEAAGLEGHLVPGLKVEVTVPEVPYIRERAYVPLNRIPTASSITDFITPELIYPTNWQVFDLGVYPPIQDDWALCSSQKCDQAEVLPSPSLDPWKVGWIESLLRFRWLPPLTTENARFKLEIQNDSGTVVYESDVAPGLSEEGLNSTSTGIAIDETTWLGDDPSSARHHTQILAHYWIDRSVTQYSGQGQEMAEAGKFYQYVYDGPALMPGEYTWKVARISEAVGEPEVWSPESTFIVKAAPAEPGSPDRLEQSSGKDKVVFKGKVTEITPGGFIVSTDSGSVHVRTDSDTRIFSPLTQFHDEVPLDWKVIVLGEVEPYILDKPYTPDDGKVFSGQVTDIRPGGFSVASPSGLVHMRSDASTVVHSAETGLYDEAPVGWNVHFISQVAPYLSGRAYVPNVQIPIASNVIEQMPTATDVTEHVSNRAHKRCTALGATDAGTTAFSCDDGDYVELNATDIPNGTSAVVLVQHNPKAVNCTVVSNPSDTTSILQCEDGNNKIVENYLAVGTVVQSQNDAAKLVSTAGALYSRMEQFKSQAAALNDSSLVAELSSYQDEANTGFKEAYQQAMANAAPQVLALMEMMGTLANKVSALAQAFVSGEGQLIFDDHNIQELAAQLRQFAGNYDSIIDIMVIETLADLPQQVQDKAKADIKNVSTQFLSNMQSALEQTAQLLEQGNIPDALTLLDKITSDEEVWMQKTVQPYLNIVLAQQAIDDAKEDLSRYNDMLSETAEDKMLSEAAEKVVLSRKEDLQSRINDLNSNLLKELQQPGTVDLMPYIEALWNEMALPWDEDAMDKAMDKAYLLELEDLIKDAKTELVDYADDMEQAVKDEINAKILVLRGAIDDEDEELIQAASDDLVGALASSGSGSELEEGSLENIIKKAQELIAHAETELVDYAEYMEQIVKDEIEAKKLTLSQTLGSEDPFLIQDAIDALLTALAKYESTSEEESEGGLTTKIINQALSVADGIIEDSENKLEPGLLNNLKQRADLLQTAVAGGDEDLIKAAFNDLTVLLEEFKNYTPDIQVGGTIECAAQVLVGKAFECSFSHTVLPDQVTWSAPGGAPASGTGETFQTTFSTVGQFSISIKACVGEDCVTDVQTVTVVEELPSDEPSEEQQPEAQLSITIECAAQVLVGKAFECSSKHTVLPDQVTWSAPGGAPASGTGETFQTTFATVGQFSISIKACVSSDCVTDSQSITVIEDNSQEEPSDDQSSEGSPKEEPSEDQPSVLPSDPIQRAKKKPLIRGSRGFFVSKMNGGR